MIIPNNKNSAVRIIPVEFISATRLSAMSLKTLGFYVRLVSVAMVGNYHPKDDELAAAMGMSKAAYRRNFELVEDLFYCDSAKRVLRPKRTPWLMPYRGGKITALLSKLFAKWGPNCVYCGSQGPIEVDHIIPKSRGGPDAFENYAPACADCNRRKAKKTAAEFGFPDVHERAQRLQ